MLALHGGQGATTHSRSSGAYSKDPHKGPDWLETYVYRYRRSVNISSRVKGFMQQYKR